MSQKRKKEDTQSVTFSVDAGIISRLGRELVGRQETAVAELVKNGYDADATKVDLYFENTESPGGTLTIQDNGNGMNEEELIDGFMRLASTDKIENPISPRYKRERAGKKGIGRFAVQSLGQELILTTSKKEERDVLHLSIVWEDFESGLELSEIPCELTKVEKEVNYQGTVLTIKNLRSAWDKKTIQKVFLHVSALINPFPLSQTSSSVDPGFKVRCFQEDHEFEEEKQEVIDEKSVFLDRAIANIEGFVDQKGEGFVSIKSKRFNDVDEKNIPVKGTEKHQKKGKKWVLSYLKGISFQAHYFIYDFKYFPKGTLKHARYLSKKQGGFCLYRNNFQILAYGKTTDDWLNIDSIGRLDSVDFLPVKNSNFYGIVNIHDRKGDYFEETSSREVLFENEAFEELKEFVRTALLQVLPRLHSAKIKVEGRKTKQNFEDLSIKYQESTERLEKNVERLENLPPIEDPEVEEILEESKTITREVIEAAKKQEDSVSQNAEEISFLRVLSSLGLVIGEFTHEIRQHFLAIKGDINSLEKFILQIRKQLSKPKKLIQNLEKSLNSKRGTPPDQVVHRLKENFKSFKTYASYFDETIEKNVHRELVSVDLYDVVQKFYNVIQSDLKRSKIALILPKRNSYNLYTIPMHSSEWISILFNFYSNAKKAINRVSRPGQILIHIGQSDRDYLFLEFLDNGDGIAPENEERIFDAFFTTTSPSSSSNEQEELTGMGLGLKIVKDIITNYNGKIYLSSNCPKDYHTCFKIEIPVMKSQ